jgi:hypothetical protein
MQKYLQSFPGDPKIRSGMGIGICRRSKWINGIIFSLVCCGMLFVEIHGILGHSHSIPSNVGNQVEFRTSSGPQLNAIERDNNYPFCSLCYFYRLIGHSIISHTDWHIDSRSVDLAVFIHHFFVARTCRIQQGTRSPPQV